MIVQLNTGGGGLLLKMATNLARLNGPNASTDACVSDPVFVLFTITALFVLRTRPKRTHGKGLHFKRRDHKGVGAPGRKRIFDALSLAPVTQEGTDE